jgi:hypothetical protein
MPVEDGEWDDQGEEAEVVDAISHDSNPFGEPPEEVVPPVEDEEPSEDPPEPEPDPIPQFDPRVRQDFEGLLYLGRLTDQFTWLGHRFTIRTLTAGEILEVGLLHRQYVGTLADVKAYQAAVVAACCIDVDGKPMPVPITNQVADTELLNRFQFVLQSWFPPTLDAIYERYLLLEARVEEVIRAMGEAQGWTDSTPTLTGTSV